MASAGPGWDPASLPKAGNERTGPLPLHPMTAGDILDGGFRLLKANLRTIVLVAAAFVIPLNLIAAFLQRNTLGGVGFVRLLSNPALMDPETMRAGQRSQLVGTLILLFVGLFITPVVGGAITRIVASSYLGLQCPPREAFRVVLRRYWALFGAFLCVHLLELAGAIGCLVGALFVMALFVTTTPALIVEGLGPIRAMGRSIELARSRYWPTLGIALLAGFIANFVAGIIGTPFQWGALLIGMRAGWPLYAIGTIVPALVTTPFVSIVATLIYFDGRIRQEGFDLQMMAANLANGPYSPA